MTIFLLKSIESQQLSVFPEVGITSCGHMITWNEGPGYCGINTVY